MDGVATPEVWADIPKILVGGPQLAHMFGLLTL